MNKAVTFVNVLYQPKTVQMLCAACFVNMDSRKMQMDVTCVNVNLAHSTSAECFVSMDSNEMNKVVKSVNVSLVLSNNAESFVHWVSKRMNKAVKFVNVINVQIVNV